MCDIVSRVFFLRIAEGNHWQNEWAASKYPETLSWPESLFSFPCKILMEKSEQTFWILLDNKPTGYYAAIWSREVDRYTQYTQKYEGFFNSSECKRGNNMICSITPFRQIKNTLNNAAYFIKHIYTYLRIFKGTHGKGEMGLEIRDWGNKNNSPHICS